MIGARARAEYQLRGRAASESWRPTRTYPGQGHAADLMQYALKAALHISEMIGAARVITHPLDDAAREFHRQFDFEDLPFDPQRATILRMADLKRRFGEREKRQGVMAGFLLFSGSETRQ